MGRRQTVLLKKAFQNPQAGWPPNENKTRTGCLGIPVCLSFPASHTSSTNLGVSSLFLASVLVVLLFLDSAWGLQKAVCFFATPIPRLIQHSTWNLTFWVFLVWTMVFVKRTGSRTLSSSMCQSHSLSSWTLVTSCNYHLGGKSKKSSDCFSDFLFAL